MDEAPRRRLSFTCGLGLAVTAAALFGGSMAGEAVAESPCGLRCVLVEVTLVKSRAFAPKVMLTGAIEPRFSSNIGFRISGKIDQRLVEVGDHITSDQVLARLDPQVQRFQPLEQHPRVKRRHARAGLAQEGVQVFLDELFRRENDAQHLLSVGIVFDNQDSLRSH